MASLSFVLIFCLILAVIIVILQYFEVKRINLKIEFIENVKNSLYLVAEKITKANSEDEVYRLIINAAVELIPDASRGSVLLLDEDSMFHFRALKGYSDELKMLTLKKEEAYLYKLNNFSETAIVKDPNRFDEDTVSRESVERLNDLQALDISCTLTSPIYIDEKLIGMINVDSTVKGKVFTNADVALMNYIKNELQLALKNSFIQSKLKFMANYDELTGLFNRRYFKQFLTQELHKIRRYKTEGCLALIDLDDFKNINDTYGHNMGDKALRFFADILRENIRKSDIYARMSGDEFVILFVNCNKENAVERLESMRKIIREKSMEDLKISFSYGVCQIDPDLEMSPDDIFGYADKEMYIDKSFKEKR